LAFCFGHIADRIGRRPAFFAYTFGAAIMVLVYSRLTDPIQLLVTGAVMGFFHVSRQPFIPAAGWTSPVYVDVHVMPGAPALRREVTDLTSRYVSAMPPPRPPGLPLPPGS